MPVIGDKNQISEDVFDFMISYLPFTQKSIPSELAKLFSISIFYGSAFILDQSKILSSGKELNTIKGIKSHNSEKIHFAMTNTRYAHL